MNWTRDGRIHSVTKRISADHSRLYLHMLFRDEDTALVRLLAVKVLPGDWSIGLEASRKWIVIKWEPLETMRESTEATQHRCPRTPCKRRYSQYQWTIKTAKYVTKSIIVEMSVLYCERHELSRCMKDFLKTLVTHEMPEACQFAFLREVYTNSPSGFRHCHDGHMAEVCPGSCQNQPRSS
jgi:hypothetical protein